jgi:uncharacterized protein (UPF0212 family)
VVIALAQVLKRFGGQFLSQHRLSTPQAKAWRAIAACRTAALGGEKLACTACGHSHWQYHSCRNRHCPQCGTRAKEAWLQGRLSEVLNVPYAHLVFTLPHSLNDLYGVHPRWVIDTLFACTAQTLSEFAANPKWMGVVGGTPAFTLVLHTWTQDLGSNSVDEVQAPKWATPIRKADFLFPVYALSKVFRGKFMAALQATRETGDLVKDPQASEVDWLKRRAALYRHDWVVYAKTPMGGPAQVLEYLSRYTHRTAISQERVRAMDAQHVVFSARLNDPSGQASGKKRSVKLPGCEFVRRFLSHVLPTGVKRVRHYGVLASACKGNKLAAARQALQMPAFNAQALESAQGFMARVAKIDVNLCPACKAAPLRVVNSLAGLKQLPAPGSWVLPECRGPP